MADQATKGQGSQLCVAGLLRRLQRTYPGYDQ